MPRNSILELLSSQYNNAEVIDSENIGRINLSTAEMPDILAYDKSVNRLSLEW